jgi:hypothetical protein
LEFGPHLESLEYHASLGHYVKPLEERPVIELGHEWLWQAFNRLSSTRPVGMSQGPISYLALVQYADEMGMGPGEKEFLWDVVKKLDSHFLAEVARRNKPPPPPTTNKPPPPRRR